MPKSHEIVPGDIVKGGVALRSNEEELWIHPYILRVVCANGSIQPLAIQSTLIVRQDTGDSYRTEHDFISSTREAIRRCLDKSAIQIGVEEMREARSKGIDSAVRLLQTIEFLNVHSSSLYFRKITPMLMAEALELSERDPTLHRRVPVEPSPLGQSLVEYPFEYSGIDPQVHTRYRHKRAIGNRTRHIILQRFHDGGDPTVYGLMNAITSVARDSQDPEERWRLEEVGGMTPLTPNPIEDLTKEHAGTLRSTPTDVTDQCYVIDIAARE